MLIQYYKMPKGYLIDIFPMLGPMIWLEYCNESEWIVPGTIEE